MNNLDADFKRLFPAYSFQLKEFQKKVIENTFTDNTLCIMPTGGGKSIIYWMSGLETDGCTIVISPLIALIIEQAQKLRDHGYEVLSLYGAVPIKEQERLLSDFAKGYYSPSFIFVSPEKIALDGFFEYCIKQRKQDIKLIAIDEVHCVSQWGMSFRPFYARIPAFLDSVFGDKWCRILAMTATLNPREKADICGAFQITDDNVLTEKMLMRSDITIHIKKFTDEITKEAYFWELVEQQKDRKTLVYLYRKKNERGVIDLYEKAVEKGYKAACFHGDMDADARTEIVDKFKTGEIQLVIATNAFGMGIDIEDIGCVIHFMIPESAEQYYQEIGRASRNGLGADAFLLYSNKNIDIKRKYFIDRSFPTEDKLRDTFQKLQTGQDLVPIKYYEDDEIQDCLQFYLNFGLADIVVKGFDGIRNATDIKDEKLKEYFGKATTKGFNNVLSRNHISPQELTETVYRATLEEKVKWSKRLERWPVLKVNTEEIDDSTMEAIMKDIAEKKAYKNELLDYFVQVLERADDSRDVHRDIASYLGMNKSDLDRIYVTADGNHVRSKSEVIISNLLAESNLRYVYEEPLEYAAEKTIKPDFTIHMSNGDSYYWEHLGMIGTERYDATWKFKKPIYDELYSGRLLVTYEGCVLSKTAQKIIENLLAEEAECVGFRATVKGGKKQGD